MRHAGGFPGAQQGRHKNTRHAGRAPFHHHSCRCCTGLITRNVRGHARADSSRRRRSAGEIVITSNLTSSTGFASFNLSQDLQRGIAALGFEEPRPIQSATVPAALEGRDVLGLAQTGTGKTAAFALPILERLLIAGRRPGPRALIVAPTRELATQITVEIKALAKFTKISLATIYGGVGMGPQIDAIRRSPDIIVACPGRLLDIAERGELRLLTVQTLVLDEADHMFDMGFLPDLQRIIKRLPEKRQNLLFSATMPGEIRELADRMLDDPHVVELAHSRPADTIEHALYPVHPDDKLDMLQYLLEDDDFTSAIVFSRTKHRARRLAQQLQRDGFRATALQGNMSQSQRDKAMQGFRKGRFEVLVATDIAARGIDVANVSHVINFDVPDTPDAYTHRIGRTGRSEQSGKACTLVTREDVMAVRDIERKLGAHIPRRNVDGFESIPFVTPDPSKAKPAGGNGNGNGNGGGNRGNRNSRGNGSRPSRPPRDRDRDREPANREDDRREDDRREDDQRDSRHSRDAQDTRGRREDYPRNQSRNAGRSSSRNSGGNSRNSNGSGGGGSRGPRRADNDRRR